MTESISRSRLLWSCRRGMLELDTLLMPFFNEVYDQLSEVEQGTFQRLLDCEDPLLFSWFMHHKKCPDNDFVKMIDAILQYAKA